MQCNAVMGVDRMVAVCGGYGGYSKKRCLQISAMFMTAMAMMATVVVIQTAPSRLQVRLKGRP